MVSFHLHLYPVNVALVLRHEALLHLVRQLQVQRHPLVTVFPCPDEAARRFREEQTGQEGHPYQDYNGHSLEQHAVVVLCLRLCGRLTLLLLVLGLNTRASSHVSVGRKDVAEEHVEDILRRCVTM